LHQTSDEDAEKEQATAWLCSWTNAPPGADLAVLPPEIAEDIRFRRSVELLSLGMADLAAVEYDALRRDKSQDAAALYQLALAARDLGMYPLSLRSAIDLIGLAPESSVLEMPRLIQRLAFPLYFADLVVGESAAYNIDPLLMFSLIRQESVFGDVAVSWAGAVGLAQVMPSTGEWIAEMMPWPQYTTDLLKRAYVNVKFGTWFLDRILHQTDGNVAAALAGYNGGPRNALNWLEEAGGDPDLFVEVITRDEPQRYVREIYRHYAMYVHLYGTG
jgi:soluble lytic murein transglycosylase